MKSNSAEVQIARFIAKHHVMTLSTVDNEGNPWCCNLFYVYIPQSNEFIFTSAIDSNHIAHAMVRSRVSGSIVLESKLVGKLQGLQFSGVLTSAACKSYKELFLKAFPYALFSLHEMWKIEMQTAKLTDNTLGFGTKLLWSKFDHK